MYRQTVLTALVINVSVSVAGKNIQEPRSCDTFVECGSSRTELYDNSTILRFLMCNGSFCVCKISPSYQRNVTAIFAATNNMGVGSCRVAGWPTQNFDWVGHGAFGQCNNWPVCSLVVAYKIS